MLAHPRVKLGSNSKDVDIFKNRIYYNKYSKKHQLRLERTPGRAQCRLFHQG